MSFPIIFFHVGFDPYLAFTVWQARRTNPESPVWLIGDATNDLSCLGVRHFPMANYAGQRDEFVAVYKNLSSHGPEYERVCFERWFYLAVILAQEGIQEFAFADSDYFFLDNILNASKSWSRFDLAGAPVWAFAWFAQRSTVQRFCDFLLERYRDSAFVAGMEKTFLSGVDLWPPDGLFNVSDMVLWRIFIKEHSIRHLDLTTPQDGVVFDNAFGGSYGFKTRRDYKLIERRPEGYFGYHQKSAQWVRYAGLHFNGKYPKRLAPNFTGWPANVLMACWRPNYRRNLRKLFLIVVHWLVTRRWLLVPSPSL